MREYLAAAMLLVLVAGQGKGETWQIEARGPPFDDSSPAVPISYTALDRAGHPWRFCILYPHMKDAYWLSVNYRMVEEARRLGVAVCPTPRSAATTTSSTCSSIHAIPCA